MNSNLFLFIGFSLVFFIQGIISLQLSENMFLGEFLGNSSTQSIILAFLIYITGRKIIGKNNVKVLSIIFWTLMTCLLFGPLFIDIFQIQLPFLLPNLKILFSTYIICIGGILFNFYSQNIEIENKFGSLDRSISENHGNLRSKILHYKKNILLVCGIVLFFLFSILPGIGKPIYTDEFHWIAYPNSYDKRIYPEELYGITPRERLAGNIVFWDSYFTLDLDGLTVFPGSGVTTGITQLFSYLHYQFTYGTDFFKWETHLFFGRLGVVLTNIIGAIVVFVMLFSYNYKRVAYLFVISFLSFPILQAYSGVVNHDSINGILLTIPILGLYLLLNHKYDKKVANISGIFFALAVFSSGKSYWISPFLLIIIITYHLLTSNLNKRETHQKIFSFTPPFVKSFILTSIIIFPSVLKYPELLFKPSIGFFFVPILTLSLFYWFIYKNITFFSKYTKIIHYVLTLLMRLTVLIIIIYISYLYFNREIIYNLYENNFYNPKSLHPINFVNYSYLGFLSYSNLFFIAIFFIALISTFNGRVKLEKYILVYLFLFLGVSNLFMIFVSSTTWSHNVLSAKYLLVFFPIIILFTLMSIKNYLKSNIFMLILILGLIINISYDYYRNGYVASILYTNGTFNSGLLPHTTEWGSNAHKTVDYINNNKIIFRGTQIFNHSIDINSYLLDKTIKTYPWHARAYENVLLNSDYFIIPYHLEIKNSNFNKGVLPYYYKNLDPIWSIEKDGITVTGIWKNNIELTQYLINEYVENSTP